MIPNLTSSELVGSRASTGDLGTGIAGQNEGRTTQ